MMGARKCENSDILLSRGSNKVATSCEANIDFAAIKAFLIGKHIFSIVKFAARKPIFQPNGFTK